MNKWDHKVSIVIILGRNDGILDLSGSQAYEYMATFRMYIEDVWGMNESMWNDELLSTYVLKTFSYMW